MTAHAALDAAATRMESGFAGVLGQLSALRAGLADLVDRLARLDQVLNDQRAQDQVIDAVKAAMQEVRDALGACSAVATPPRVRSACRDAMKAVAAMESPTRMLNALASLSLITARSLGLDGLDDYVRNLRLLCADLMRDASSVGEAVASLRERRERAGALFRSADAALSEVGRAIENHANERAAKERMLAATIHHVEVAIDNLPARLAQEMEILVRAMQFADAAAQRIDHIRTILARGGAAETALAAAQIDALVGAAHETLAEARTSIARIADIAATTGRVLSKDRDTPETQADAAVELNRALLGSLVRASEIAMQATGGAAEESAALQRLAQEGTRRSVNLAEATDAIHVAAINAALLARAADGQQKAINVLSVDVQQQAAVCARVAAASKSAIAEMTRSEDLAVFAAVIGKAEVFRHAIGETQQAIGAADAALVELEGLRRGASESLRLLGPALAQAEAALARIAATADDLGDLARGLPRNVPAGSGPLADLFGLYTMEAERSVHRDLFGLPDDRSRAVAPAGPDRRMPPDADPAADLLAAVLF